MSQLPTNRTTSSTAAQHVADHNELHRLHNITDLNRPTNTRYVSTAGSDSTGDGLYWGSAFRTVGAAVTSLINANFIGDVYIADGDYTETSQIFVPAGISLHGNARPKNQNNAFTGGTRIVWNGADSGSVIKTRNPGDATSGYDAGGIIENINIQIPTSGGSSPYNNVRAIDVTGFQNLGLFRRVSITGGKKEGFYVILESGGPQGSPGFVRFEQCWTIGAGSYPFHFEGGFSTVILEGCGVDDDNLNCLAAYHVGASDDGKREADLTLVMTGCKFEGGSSPTSGQPGDCPFLLVDSSADCQVVMVAPWGTHQGATTMSSYFVDYEAAPTMPDDNLSGVPVHIVGASSQTYTGRIKAPNATPAIDEKPETTPASGNRDRWSWDRANRGIRAIPYKISKWYNDTTLQTQNPSGGIQFTANATVWLVPFVPRQTHTFTGIGVNVRTGGSTGSVLRLGVFNSDNNAEPSTVLLDAGTVASTTTGDKTVSSLSIPLERGRLYFLAVASQGSAVTQPIVAGEFMDVPYVGNGSISGNSFCGYVASASGAFSTLSAPGVNTDGAPRILLLA